MKISEVAHCTTVVNTKKVRIHGHIIDLYVFINMSDYGLQHKMKTEVQYNIFKILYCNAGLINKTYIFQKIT